MLPSVKTGERPVASTDEFYGTRTTEFPPPRTTERRANVRRSRGPRFTIPTSPLFLAAYAAIAVLLLGGGTTVFLLDKKVDVVVDGKPQTVHTFSHSVQGALSSADVNTGSRDFVAPGPTSSISSGSRVVVNHARRLTMDVDGKTRTVWTTGLTVGAAADQLGISDAAQFSVPRSHRLPRGDFHVSVRLPKRLVILLDQVRLETQSAAATVSGVLHESGIKLGKHDRVSQKLSAAPHNGMVIKVLQLLSKPEVKTVKVAAPVKKKKDPNLTVGEKKVLHKGHSGVKQVVTAYVMQRGHKVRRVIATTWKRRPQTTIVEVGSKMGGVGGDADHLNWSALAQCESHGNPKAVNSAGYYGLYQFNLQSWHSVGGSGKPTDAGAAEQTYRAKLLYKKVDGRWQGQWPVCGKKLFS